MRKNSNMKQPGHRAHLTAVTSKSKTDSENSQQLRWNIRNGDIWPMTIPEININRRNRKKYPANLRTKTKATPGTQKRGKRRQSSWQSETKEKRERALLQNREETSLPNVRRPHSSQEPQTAARRVQHSNGAEPETGLGVTPKG